MGAFAIARRQAGVPPVEGRTAGSQSRQGSSQRRALIEFAEVDNQTVATRHRVEAELLVEAGNLGVHRVHNENCAADERQASHALK